MEKKGEGGTVDEGGEGKGRLGEDETDSFRANELGDDEEGLEYN